MTNRTALIAAAMLVPMLLTACVDAGYAPYDPYREGAVADAAIQATADAHYYRAQAATLEAGQERLAVEATAQAFAWQATAGAATAQAEAAALASTAQANATQAAWLATATPLAATQAAVVRAVDEAEAEAAVEATRRSIWAWLQPVLVFIAACALLYVLVSGTRTIMHWSIAWIDRQQTLRYEGGHMLEYIEYEDGTTGWQLLVPRSPLADLNPRRPAGQPPGPPVTFSPGKVTAMSSTRVQSPTTARLALDLLRAAANIAGDDARLIPGWRELGWSSDSWQRAVKSLKAAGLVTTTPGGGGGTELAAHTCLADLYYDLENGKIVVRPAA